MRSAVIVTAVFFVAAQSIPHTLMKIFTSDPEVIEQGGGLSSDCQLVLYFYGDYADLSLYYEKCRAGCCGDSCILMLSDL